MGLLVCPKHGNGFLFVCPHLAAAVHSGIEHRAYTAADDPTLADLSLACWYCPACIAEYSLPPDQTAIELVDEFLERTSALHRPICPKCFEEWRYRSLSGSPAE